MICVLFTFHFPVFPSLDHSVNTLAETFPQHLQHQHLIQVTQTYDDDDDNDDDDNAENACCPRAQTMLR
jgi:hypothetical protein